MQQEGNPEMLIKTREKSRFYHLHIGFCKTKVVCLNKSLVRKKYSKSLDMHIFNIFRLYMVQAAHLEFHPLFVQGLYSSIRKQDSAEIEHIT